MEPEVLKVLAGSVAGLLVKGMATGAWEMVKKRFSTVLGRGDDTEVADLGLRLEESRADLENASDDEREDAAKEIIGEWRGTVRTLLARDPEVAAELRKLLDELTDDVEKQSASVQFSQRAKASDKSTVQQAGGNITIHHGQAAK